MDNNVVEDDRRQSTPPRLRPGQEHLYRSHRYRMLPQCLCLQGRETDCAPLWLV